MTEGLARKKSIRAGHRGSATRMMNLADDLLAAHIVDEARLAQLKLSLEEKLGTLKQLDGAILDLTKVDHLEDEIQAADEFKDRIYSILVKLDKPKRDPTPVALAAPPTRDPDNRVKLPKLTIQPFDGDVTKWTPFWDCYDSAIHQNSSLTGSDKFNYLRSLLKGTAKEAVSGLMLTAANYEEAIGILKKRFGNRQQIISRHMDLLMNVEPITSHSNVKGLRQLYDVVESNVRSLKSLGVTADSYGSLLASVLMNKLPSELQLIIGRKIGDDDWKLDVILQELVQEIEARERTGASTVTQPKRPPKQMPTTAALLSSNAQQLRCCFCDQQHSSEKCKAVKGLDDRKRALMKTGRCFLCLRKRHITRDCRVRTRCSECGGKHHPAICAGTNPRESEAPPPATNPPDRTPLNPEAGSFQPTSASLLVGARGTALLQTARVRIYDPEKPGRSVDTRAILDTGSQQSYATQRVKDALGLKAHNHQSMSIATFGSDEQKTQVCDTVRIGVVAKEGRDQELELLTVPFICQPLTPQPIDLCMTKYQHLSDLDLADHPNSGSVMEVDLLIGSDYYWSFVTGETRRGDGGPVAVRTKLGWVLSGMVPGQRSSHSLLTTHVLRVDASPHHTENLEELLHSFWNLESLGIEDPESSVLEEFTKTVCFKEGRYEVSLPWKDACPPLPDNYELSKKRLGGLLNRLKQSPDIMHEYDTIIKTQLQHGIVEEVDQPDKSVTGRIHYLPHHAVVRKDKETTKVRVVYDASARSTGCSLNECLHRGPKFEQRILDILLRFRTYPVALTADLEKAFLMVSVSEEDRDVLRFLWVDDVGSDTPTTRFARVVFGVSSSPFLLNATLQCHLNQYTTSHTELVRRLTQSMYVDDIVSGAQNEQQAYELYLDSKEVFRRGGFNLRKFVTNSAPLQQMINEQEGLTVASNAPSRVSHSDETYTKATLGAALPMQFGEQKILGVRWDVGNDQLRFGFDDIARLATELEPTKRHLVSIVGRFYDPMGLLSPIVIRFKILFQELCSRKQEWDQTLDGDLLQKWNKLISELQCSPTMSLPRCFWSNCGDTSENSCTLYGFCDASKHAYAAVIYLVIESPSGRYIRFVVSKTRVSPLKSQTIPRLELLSALLLARLMKSVTGSLEPELTLTQPKCYTDSEVALYWIKGLNRVWKQFVQHRVAEIRTLLPSECWQHCPGAENPADLPSRGLAPSDLAASDLWINGPAWLGTATTDDPSQEVPMPTECAAELTVKNQPAALNLLVTNEGPSLSKIISCHDFSSIRRLIRVTAHVLRFVHNLKKKLEGNVSDDDVATTASQDLAGAEVLWIKAAQTELASDNNFEKLKKQFNLFEDRGVWRCGGRLAYADVPFQEKYPVLLPKNHHLATLVVRAAHERVFHNGVKDTLTEVRSRFWILKGRALVKKIVHQCVVCRKSEGNPYLGPSPPPLPEFRLKEDPPFTYTGVDFAGPLYVKASSATASSKVWICLYTCCVVRAVHLDIVPDMTTAAFIRSLKRFSARRGLPRKFVSDNGKTFKAVAKAIDTMMRDKAIQEYLSGLKVEWLFNLERAPWWGGVFERMVRMTKRCLKKMVGRARLTYEELNTVVIEVEAVINSRPLSYMTADDIEQPLTPAHLIAGRRLLSLPDPVCHEDDFEISANHLTKRLAYLNRILDKFWKRWRNEYLAELRDSHRYGGKSSDATLVSVGDIVLVHDDSKPRGSWKLARIEEVIIGRDGRTRGAVLRVASASRRGTVLQRPLQRLYPLEISSSTPDKEKEKPDETAGCDRVTSEESAAQERQSAVPVRSRRAAAMEARNWCRALAACEQDEDSD